MGAKILIVEESPEMIDILLDILPENMKKQVATNGIAALALLRSGNDLPDLILLDIKVPVIDGFELCRRIKEINKLKEIPVIFISSPNESLDKVKAFDTGAVDYITKPFNREEVLARIETHLELYRSRRIIKELYSETIQGIMGAMNDMLLIANPEVSKYSNSIKFYSEKIMEELGMSNVWDLKLACVFSGLGMLSENVKKAEMKHIDNISNPIEDIELSIEKAYKSLKLSKDIINKIPRFQAVSKIIENARFSLEEEYIDIPIEDMESEILKGHILRIVIFYFYKFEEGENYIHILNEMRISEREYYSLEIIEALNKVQNNLINSEISNIKIKELRPKMILVENLYCPQGRLMLKSGSELSEQMIMLIRNFESLEDKKIDIMKG